MSACFHPPGLHSTPEAGSAHPLQPVGRGRTMDIVAVHPCALAHANMPGRSDVTMTVWRRAKHAAFHQENVSATIAKNMLVCTGRQPHRTASIENKTPAPATTTTTTHAAANKEEPSPGTPDRIYIMCSVLCEARGGVSQVVFLLPTFPPESQLLRGGGERPGPGDWVALAAATLGPAARCATSSRFLRESVRGRVPLKGGNEWALVVNSAGSRGSAPGSPLPVADQKTGALRFLLQGHSGARHAAPRLTRGASCCSCPLCSLFCAAGAGSAAACPPGGPAADRPAAA